MDPFPINHMQNPDKKTITSIRLIVSKKKAEQGEKHDWWSIAFIYQDERPPFEKGLITSISLEPLTSEPSTDSSAFAKWNAQTYFLYMDRVKSWELTIVKKFTFEDVLRVMRQAHLDCRPVPQPLWETRRWAYNIISCLEAERLLKSGEIHRTGHILGFRYCTDSAGDPLIDPIPQMR